MLIRREVLAMRVVLNFSRITSIVFVLNSEEIVVRFHCFEILKLQLK